MIINDEVFALDSPRPATKPSAAFGMLQGLNAENVRKNPFAQYLRFICLVESQSRIPSPEFQDGFITSEMVLVRPAASSSFFG